MRFPSKMIKHILLILPLFFIFSCKTTETQDSIDSNRLSVPDSITNPNNRSSAQSDQIGEYVVETFAASNGDLWFGTLAKGVARYNGQGLTYFTMDDGLPSNRISNIVEDESGNVWFGTGNGLSKFDGKSFINYSKKDGLSSNLISNLIIDHKGMLWIGTWSGVGTFDGETFRDLPIPYPKVETQINEDTKDWITAIKEDLEGNIWFARDGYGVCKYDGSTFTHYLKKNGLHSNNVTEIEIDKDGNYWIGTRVAEKDHPDPKKRMGKGGINLYDGTTIKSFPEIAGFNDGDVYGIYRDRMDHIWISTTNHGVYKYDGEEFKNYDIPVSVMSMTEDSNGNLWLGAAGGLYRISAQEEIINVTVNGPWEDK